MDKKKSEVVTNLGDIANARGPVGEGKGGGGVKGVDKPMARHGEETEKVKSGGIGDAIGGDLPASSSKPSQVRL